MRARSLILRKVTSEESKKGAKNSAVENQDSDEVGFAEDSWLELDVTEEDVEQMVEAQTLEE